MWRERGTKGWLVTCSSCDHVAIVSACHVYAMWGDRGTMMLRRREAMFPCLIGVEKEEMIDWHDG